MTLLERLLGHDNWTTQHLLKQCEQLGPNDWRMPFVIGHMTLYDTVDHMLRNVEIWTDLMMARTPRRQRPQETRPATHFFGRWQQAYSEFSNFALEIEQNGRSNHFWTDTLDEPPREKTYGGAILHVITHNMQHRAEAMHMMRRLGIEDVIEGDLLSWERRQREGA